MVKSLFLAGLVLVPLAARADEHVKTPDAKQMHTDDCAKARAKKRDCVIDMKGESITGTVGTGTGSVIGALEPGKNPSLIHIRRDFIVEILKSAEDL